MNRRALLLLLLSSIPLWQTRAENLDISANGGIGVAERDAFGLRAVPSAGLSIGAAITPRHKFQFDYTVGHMERETASAGGFAPSIHNRHFFTGSYVLQSVRGRV